MSQLVLKNISHIYTPDLSGSFGDVISYHDVDVLIEEGKISAIVESTGNIAKGAEKTIDAKGKTVLPGFVDAHTHPVFWNTRESEFAMRIQGKSYEEIAAAGGGIRNSARSFRSASKQQIKDVTKKRIARFLEYGTTTIEAKSGYGLATDDEIKSLEIIRELNKEQPLEMVPTFLGAHEVPDEFQHDRESYVDLVIKEMIPRVAAENLAEFCDVFCEEGVFTVGQSERILRAAQKAGMRIRIHADELSSSGGAELAASIGAVTADHLIRISDAGILAMSEKNVIAVLLPVTTFFLRKEEYAPARKMIDAGCRVAIATDFNPGSSMTQNLQLGWSIAALKLGMNAGELLWSTTINAARSLDRGNRIGAVETGRQADLVCLDIPNLDYLPYHLGVNHVAWTIKKGEVVYQNQRREEH